VESTDASAQLILALSGGDLTASAADTIVSAFNTAWRRSGDAKAVGSSLEQLEFLKLMCSDAVAGAAPWLDGIMTRLEVDHDASAKAA
jgi:hypothetical protein